MVVVVVVVVGIEFPVRFNIKANPTPKVSRSKMNQWKEKAISRLE